MPAIKVLNMLNKCGSKSNILQLQLHRVFLALDRLRLAIALLEAPTNGSQLLQKDVLCVDGSLGLDVPHYLAALLQGERGPVADERAQNVFLSEFDLGRREQLGVRFGNV
jgi:hypothetical protein